MTFNPFAFFRSVIPFLSTILSEIRMANDALTRIQNDIAGIVADIDAIKTILANAANDSGLTATQAGAVADQLDAAKTALDAVVNPPAAPTETPVTPTP